MSIKSEREKYIKAYIDANPNCSMGRTKRLEIEGQVQELPIYRLPINLLVFNIENGRFAADLYTHEERLRRKLNPWKQKDRVLIQRILLDKYPHETKRLREDLEKVGQMDTGVITSAGVVINGNRRMAILMELYGKISRDKFNYLEVVILPRHLSDAEIYKIEAKLQYAKDFKIGYGPVNELLKMREGIDKGMTKRKLADLLGRDEKYIDEHLEQLELLKAYSKYTWKSVNYKKIEAEAITEPMTDVVKNLKKFKDEGLNPSEIKKWTELQFAYIKAGCSYRDIRVIGKINAFEKVKPRYFNALNMLKKKKISEESFKELVDDANEAVRIIRKEQRPVEVILELLTDLKGFRDEKNEITSEIKGYLKEMMEIICEMLKSKK